MHQAVYDAVSPASASDSFWLSSSHAAEIQTNWTLVSDKTELVLPFRANCIIYHLFTCNGNEVTFSACFFFFPLSPFSLSNIFSVSELVSKGFVLLDVDGAQRLAAGLCRLHHRHFGLLSRLLLVTGIQGVKTNEQTKQKSNSRSIFGTDSIQLGKQTDKKHNVSVNSLKNSLL